MLGRVRRKQSRGVCVCVGLSVHATLLRYEAGTGQSRPGQEACFLLGQGSPVFICLKFPLNDELVGGKNLVLFDIES